MVQYAPPKFVTAAFLLLAVNGATPPPGFIDLSEVDYEADYEAKPREGHPSIYSRGAARGPLLRWFQTTTSPSLSQRHSNANLHVN